MKPKRLSPRDLRGHCADSGADDGVDPREFLRSGGRKGASDRKARQLCSQIADTLNLVLSGECDDQVLQGLYVVGVDEAPSAYKDIHAVMRAQRELARIERKLRPVLSYKGV